MYFAKLIAAFVLICSSFLCASGCTTTTDPKKASTGDILFDSGRFERENERRREALRRLQVEHQAAEVEEQELIDELEDHKAALADARDELAGVEQEIDELAEQISAVRRRDRSRPADLAEQNRLQTDLARRSGERATLQEEIRELEEAIGSLEMMIAKRRQLLREE